MKVITLGNYSGSYLAYIEKVQLLVGLKRKGVDITVVGSFCNDTKEIFLGHNIDIIEDHPTKSIDLGYIRRIRELIRKEGFDIIHLFSGKTVRNGVLSSLGIPIRVLVYLGSTSVHWHDPTAYLAYLNPKIEKLLCISDDVRRHASNQLFGKNKSKPVLIYKGYDVEWFSGVESFDYNQLGIPESSKVVCMVANSRRVKDVPTFLNSTNHLNYSDEIHFVLIGQNTKAQEFEKIRETSPIKDNIHLLGYQKQAASYIKACDIYVQTSLSEGLGRAIIEAMCFAKPIIMTNAGGCTELIGNSDAGFIVPKGSAKEIALRIKELAKDKVKLNRMGNLALQRIKEKFDLQSTIDKTFSIYTYPKKQA